MFREHDSVANRHRALRLHRALTIERLESRQLLSLEAVVVPYYLETVINGDFPREGENGEVLLLESAPPSDPVLAKLSTPLREAASMPTHDKSEMARVPGLRLNDAGKLMVRLRVEPIADVVDLLENHGLDVSTTSDFYVSYIAVEGWLEATAIEDLAALPFVYSIEVPLAPELRTGSVNSAGDGILRSDAARSRFASQGVDGSGIRVGVISDGVTDRAYQQARRDWVSSPFDPPAWLNRWAAAGPFRGFSQRRLPVSVK